MGKIGAIIYQKFKPPISVNQVFQVCNSLGFDIQFVIEAGSHHGTDTVQFLEDKNIKKIFCFEPNAESRTIFKENVKKYPVDKYVLYNFGLSSFDKDGFLYSPTIDLGSERIESAGNSSLSKTWGKSDGNGHTVSLKKLDTVFQHNILGTFVPQGRTGLLWLDVEGFALDALIGMRNTLKHVAVGKIELEYGKQPGQWEKKTIFRIMSFMSKNGFIPYSGYLHPVTRGDMFFIHISGSNLGVLVKSFKYFSLALFFYGVVYPVKSKLQFKR